MTKKASHGQIMVDILTALNIKQTELSKQTKIVQSHLSLVIHGKKGISYGMIEKLIQVFPQINTNRIFTGSGPVLLPKWQQYDTVEESQAPYKTDDPLFRARHHLLAALGEVDAAIAKNCQ